MFTRPCVTLLFIMLQSQLSRELWLINLMRFNGLPYIWGGNGPHGYDCSGLVEAAHKLIGVLYAQRFNSQQLHNLYANNPKLTIDQADLGDLAFFGASLDAITHVGLCVGYGLMLEAAHGDHTCTTPEIAYARGAMVMVNPIAHRRDLQAVVKVPIGWPSSTAQASQPGA